MSNSMLDGKSHGCHVKFDCGRSVIDQLDLGVQRFVTSDSDLGGGETGCLEE